MCSGHSEVFRGLVFEADARKTIEAILANALGRDSDCDYVLLWRAAHGSLEPLMPKNTRHWPGDVHTVKLADREMKIICTGRQLEKDSPQKWYEEVFAIIRDPARDPAVRCDFIAELARSVLGNETVRSFLESLVSSDANPAVRCTAARALRKAAVEFPHIRKLILDRFRDPEVSADDRRCYGRALADAAPLILRSGSFSSGFSRTTPSQPR